jgi:hypothetical protein
MCGWDVSISVGRPQGTRRTGFGSRPGLASTACRRFLPVGAGPRNSSASPGRTPTSSPPGQTSGTSPASPAPAPPCCCPPTATGRCSPPIPVTRARCDAPDLELLEERVVVRVAHARRQVNASRHLVHVIAGRKPGVDVEDRLMPASRSRSPPPALGRPGSPAARSRPTACPRSTCPRLPGPPRSGSSRRVANHTESICCGNSVCREEVSPKGHSVPRMSDALVGTSRSLSRPRTLKASVEY